MRTDAAATEVSRSIHGRNLFFKKSEASEAAAPGSAWRDSNSPIRLPAVTQAESGAIGKEFIATSRTRTFADARSHHRNYKRSYCVASLPHRDEQAHLLRFEPGHCHNSSGRGKPEYSELTGGYAQQKQAP